MNFPKKPKLSIATIGRKRFLLGFFCGLGLALSFAFFLEYLRELLRYPATYSQAAIRLSHSEAFQYSLFTGALSFTFGWCFTLFVWMGGAKYSTNRRNIFKKAAEHFSLNGLWVYAYIVFAFAMYAALFYWSKLIDVALFNLQRDYFFILILLPLLVFLQAWMFVRMVYKAGWWWLGSAFAGCIFSLLFALCFGKNPNMMNEVVNARYAVEEAVLQEELHYADSLFGQTFTPSTIATLRNWNSASRKTLETQVLKRFKENKNLSPDSLLLVGILQKTRRGQMHCAEYWPYPTPWELYEGLLLHKKDTVRRLLLERLVQHQEALRKQEQKEYFGDGSWEDYCWTYYPKKLSTSLVNMRYCLLMDSTSWESATFNYTDSAVTASPPPAFLINESQWENHRLYWKKHIDSIRATFKKKSPENIRGILSLKTN